jgi:hypothetical protein
MTAAVGRTFLVLTSAFVAMGGFAGCVDADTPARFRREEGARVAAEMSCPAAETKIVQLDDWTVGVAGCGQRKVYIDISWRGWVDDTASVSEREPHESTSWTLLSSAPAASFAARGLPRAGFEMDCGTDGMKTKRIDDAQVEVYGCGKRALYAVDDLPASGRLGDRRRFWRAVWIRPDASPDPVASVARSPPPAPPSPVTDACRGTCYPPARCLTYAVNAPTPQTASGCFIPCAKTPCPSGMTCRLMNDGPGHVCTNNPL